MKKLIALFVCITIICSAGLTATASMKDAEYYHRYFLRHAVYAYAEDRLGEAKEPNWQIGDVNCDGTVNAHDALFVLNYIFIEDEFSFENHGSNTPKKYYYGWIDERYQSNRNTRSPFGGVYYYEELYFYIYFYNSAIMADVNNDCRFSAEDALMILQYVVGKRQEFPRQDFQWDREKLMFFVWPEDYTDGMFWMNRQAKVWPPEE